MFPVPTRALVLHQNDGFPCILNFHGSGSTVLYSFTASTPVDDNITSEFISDIVNKLVLVLVRLLRYMYVSSLSGFIMKNARTRIMNVQYKLTD